MAASRQCLSFSQSKESRPLSLPWASRLCSALLPGIPPNCQSFFLYTTIPGWHVQGACLGPCPVHVSKGMSNSSAITGGCWRGMFKTNYHCINTQYLLSSYRSFLNVFRSTYVSPRLNLGELHGTPTTYSLKLLLWPLSCTLYFFLI